MNFSSFGLFDCFLDLTTEGITMVTGTVTGATVAGTWTETMKGNQVGGLVYSSEEIPVVYMSLNFHS